VTRNSSFSDRERSSSRTSLIGGTGSPLGSVSPTGYGAGSVGNGIHSVYAQGRSGVRRRNGSTESMGSKERGRSCTDGRAGVSETSSSPPRRGSTGEGTSLDAATADVSPTLSPIPSSNTLASDPLPSVVSPKLSPAARPIAPKPVLSIPIPNALPLTTEEDKHPRLTSCTTSPSVLRHVSQPVPAPPTSASASVLAEKPQSPLVPSARDSLTPPGSPNEHGTLVGRAADIVSTARGLLGVLWSGSSSNSPGVP
jgi:hypothetical protein